MQAVLGLPTTPERVHLLTECAPSKECPCRRGERRLGKDLCSYRGSAFFTALSWLGCVHLFLTKTHKINLLNLYYPWRQRSSSCPAPKAVPSPMAARTQKPSAVFPFQAAPPSPGRGKSVSPLPQASPLCNLSIITCSELLFPSPRGSPISNLL